jgi:hypothetical protein
MAIHHDRFGVLGDFDEEMERRLKAGERNRKKVQVSSVLAFCLIGFGLWPLGVWHMGAALAGLMLAYWISEEPADQLADEMDLLERKIVARLSELNAEPR